MREPTKEDREIMQWIHTQPELLSLLYDLNLLPEQTFPIGGVDWHRTQTLAAYFDWKTAQNEEIAEKTDE